MRPIVRSFSLIAFIAAVFVVSPAFASESDHKEDFVFLVRFLPFLPFCFIRLCLNLAFAIDAASDRSWGRANVLYQQDDQVTLWVNKVGPFNNPQETYNYYNLPFCHPSGNAAHKWGGLGEVLGGNELIDSQIDIKYQKNVDKSTICVLELDEAKVKQFKDAIENSYWFEFFMGMW
ncbi:unnamed protein product [Ilex paraguariensis]|uniref:Transmembrane 9 superfamily member n=1 Tax=Ilex paraguariensis TaxID=185542 RepID=A0ABC8TFR5_9AQUA